MCDVNEDKLEAEEEMTKKQKKLLDGKCMKCKEAKAVVVIRVHDPMCRACFLVYSTHKFRSTLGKSRLIKANDKVLLAVSGGKSSFAMVHFVKEALNEGAHKRLKFTPGIVFIDDSITLDKDFKQDVSHIQKMAEEYMYPFYHVPIYQDINEDTVSTEKDFSKQFQSISTLTAKTDFLTSLRMGVIVNTARKHGYGKIMIGENSTTLSIKLLCNISQGRGMTIPKDIAIGDDRYSDITIVRPMREFSSKEVALYNRLSDLEVPAMPNLSTMQESSSSLQRQTEEFIVGLQAEFPSTVSTVFRTGDKLCANENIKNVKERCYLCQSLLGDNVEETKSERSCGKGSCCGTSDECNSNNFKLTFDDIKNRLCYGCNLTFRDMNYEVNCLPSYILENVSADVKRSRMKESIQDFLLE